MNVNVLPKGYEVVKKIDLLHNGHEAIIVNVLSLILMIVMIIIGCFISGAAKIEELLLAENATELNGLIIKLFVAVVLCGIYIVAHEAVHGICMKVLCKNCKVNFGYKVIYAYAGSNSFFDKKSYILIAIAPLAIFGILLAAVCSAVPTEWFWPVYFVQILNVSGAAGDIYVFSIIMIMSKDILVRDTGVSMTVYGK